MRLAIESNSPSTEYHTPSQSQHPQSSSIPSSSTRHPCQVQVYACLPYSKFSTRWALLPVSATPWQQAYTRAETTYDDTQYRWTSYQGRSCPHWQYPSLNRNSQRPWTSTLRSFVSTVHRWEYVPWLSHRGLWDNLCSSSGRSPSLTWCKFALPVAVNTCRHWMNPWLQSCSLSTD